MLSSRNIERNFSTPSIPPRSESASCAFAATEVSSGASARHVSRVKPDTRGLANEAGQRRDKYPQAAGADDGKFSRCFELSDIWMLGGPKMSYRSPKPEQGTRLDGSRSPIAHVEASGDDIQRGPRGAGAWSARDDRDSPLPKLPLWAAGFASRGAFSLRRPARLIQPLGEVFQRLVEIGFELEHRAHRIRSQRFHSRGDIFDRVLPGEQLLIYLAPVQRR